MNKCSNEVLRAFLIDAFVFVSRAKDLLVELSKNRTIENTRNFYHLIHTLKGTSSMLLEGRPVVDALEELESTLEMKLQEAERKKRLLLAHDWLEWFHDTLSETYLTLLTLEKSFCFDVNVEKDKTDGLLVNLKQSASKKRELVWVAFSDIEGFIAFDEVQGRRGVTFKGVWTPVVNFNSLNRTGKKQRKCCSYIPSFKGSCGSYGAGLILNWRHGHVVVVASEIEVNVSRKIALERGASFNWLKKINDYLKAIPSSKARAA